jgi:hypothetical protein
VRDRFAADWIQDVDIDLTSGVDIPSIWGIVISNNILDFASC